MGVALTPYQRARWLECRLARDGPPAAGLDVRVRGPVDAEALRRRLDRLAERHAALRTTVHDGDDGPVAVVHERARVDLRLEPASRDQVLSLRADPVALDARSLGLTLLELLGRPASPAPTPAPAPVDDERDRAYWEGRLAGEMGALDLTSGRRREGRAATGVAVTAELGAARRDRLLRLAAGCAVPIHAALLAALQLLLRRYTGEPDVVIGLPVALVADAIGWHANSVVLRQELSGDGTARDLMRATARTLAEAVEHRASPIERLVGRLDPARGRAGGPFPVVATIDALVAPGADELLADMTLGEDGGEHALGALRVRPLAPPQRRLRADLELLLSTAGERPRVTFVHDPGTLPPRLVDCLRGDLLRLLDELPAGLDRPARGLLARAAMEEPRRQVPDPTHRPEGEFLEFPAGDLERSIPARFLDQVRRAPEATAVAGEDGDLTYAALARRAAGVAGAIRASCGRGAGRMGLLLDHGSAMVGAILGVLAAGRAYVPLDPSYPAERLAFMVEHSGAEAILTGGTHTPLARALRPGLPVLDVAALDVAAPDAIPRELPGPATPDTRAYVLYTSGSTGRPKGVVQDHRNVLFQVRAHTNDHLLTPCDRLSLVSSFSFDAAISDLFGALLNGAAVVPIDVRRHGVGRLAATLAKRRVTVLHATPTVYRHLLAGLRPSETLPSVRLVLLGGEAVTGRDVDLGRRHLPGHCVLVNGYGATEVSFALRNQVTGADRIDHGAVPIGWPLDGVEVALLAPDGWPACLRGEIEVRSRHVALGYWSEPELTAERFGIGPDGARAYRTGDLGRRLPDGRIVFAGRRDRQVKVRGHRVELGEIEACLAGIPAVEAAAAVPRSGGIAAYVAPAAGVPVEAVALRRALERVLPSFALPAAIVVLDRLPLTPTGKVDVRALPAPASNGGGRPARPRDGIERAVADAWRAALGRTEVGIEDRFFDLGGDSLLMAGVQRRVERALGIRVPLHRMFEHPTVAALAAFLRDEVVEHEHLDRVEARMHRRRRARTVRR